MGVDLKCPGAPEANILGDALKQCVSSSRSWDMAVVYCVYSVLCAIYCVICTVCIYICLCIDYTRHYTYMHVIRLDFSCIIPYGI